MARKVTLLLSLILAPLGGVGCGSADAPKVPGGADPAAVAVIRSWSDTLRRGDVRGAARFFALPSEFANGTRATALVLRTYADAVTINATLPCGSRLLSATPRGRYVEALFKLTSRPGLGGSSCGGASGATARTDFLIAQGKIRQWVRAPDHPGENQGQGTPGSGGGPVV